MRRSALTHPVRWSLIWPLLLLAPLARASVVVALSVEDLARRSDLVVLGQVVSLQAIWASDRRHIYRRVVVRVEESWKVGACPEEVEVVVPGGELDGLGEKVVGEPALAAGMRGVFFLERAGTTHRFVGLAQGFFEASPEGLVQRTEELALAHPSARGFAISPHGAEAASPMSVSALRARVLAVAHAAGEAAPTAP